MFCMISHMMVTLACYHLLPTGATQLGENVTFPFQFELSSPDSRYVCTVLLHGSDRPLFINNKSPFPSAFKPGQFERFVLQYQYVELSLTITFTICNLQVVDKGVYNVHIVDLVDEIVESFSEKQAVVTFPPGKAQCELGNSSTDTDWPTVRCNATLGSDGSGELVCHQDLQRLPIDGDVSTDGIFVSAVYYWIHPEIPVKCCTLEQHQSISLDQCDDVIFRPAHETLSTRDPPYETSASSTLSHFTTESKGDEENNDSRAGILSAGEIAGFVVTAVIVSILAVIFIIIVRRHRQSLTRRHEQIAEMPEFRNANLNINHAHHAVPSCDDETTCHCM